MDGGPIALTGALTTSSSEDALAQQLADLVADLQHDPTHRGALERTADAAVALVPGAQDAGICLLRARRRVSPAASTGDLVLRLDALQAETGQGPCWDAALHQRTTRVAALAAEGERWPELARRAGDLGDLSVLCLQLRSGDAVLGALKLLGEPTEAFGDGAERVASLLATHASKAIADAATVEHLRLGLAHRDVIGQAKGILMERHRLTPDQAFDLLATASQHTNRKLHEVALELASTGELPHR